MIASIAAVTATLIFLWLGWILLPEEPIIVFGAAILLGFITRMVAKKLLEIRQKKEDDSNLFPALTRYQLEKWGSKWGEQYEYLTKVILYDPPLKYPIDAEYILYFDFDTSTFEGKASEENFNKIIAFENMAILGSGFQEVYVEQPGSKFRDEWFLTIVKYAGFNDKYSWVIYQREPRDQSKYNVEVSTESNLADNIGA